MRSAPRRHRFDRADRPGILDGSPATGSRDILPMPSIDRPRPPNDLAGPPATTGRAPGREVARRVGASSAKIEELEDPTVVHFANQFGLLPQQMRQQEQMFDQFQQVMAMIVQRFGDKHRDQMQVVREEIIQIRQLSGELQSLHSRLSTSPPHSPPIPNSQPPPRDVAGRPPLDGE